MCDLSKETINLQETINLHIAATYNLYKLLCAANSEKNILSEWQNNYVFRVNFTGENKCQMFSGVYVSYLLEKNKMFSLPKIITISLLFGGNHRPVSYAAIGYNRSKDLDSIDKVMDEIERLYIIYITGNIEE